MYDMYCPFILFKMQGLGDFSADLEMTGFVLHFLRCELMNLLKWSLSSHS